MKNSEMQGCGERNAIVRTKFNLLIHFSYFFLISREIYLNIQKFRVRKNAARLKNFQTLMNINLLKECQIIFGEPRETRKFCFLKFYFVSFHRFTSPCGKSNNFVSIMSEKFPQNPFMFALAFSLSTRARGNQKPSDRFKQFQSHDKSIGTTIKF